MALRPAAIYASLSRRLDPLWLAGGVGAFAIFLAIFLVTVRKSAYVQPFDNRLRLVTPFLRMNISYRRFIQASSAEMGRLFSLEDLKGQKRAFLRPLAKHTAIVPELKGWPLPRWAFNLFLSPSSFRIGLRVWHCSSPTGSDSALNWKVSAAPGSILSTTRPASPNPTCLPVFPRNDEHLLRLFHYRRAGF